ncbi:MULTISPECIES: hypothetical protein [Actinocorallia]|uniref:Uncharacterized protein n=2 Tax=Actinocorallia TaxID=58108 RepID=A0ABP6GZ32_9ACTN
MSDTEKITPESYPAMVAVLTGAARGLLALLEHIDLAAMRTICEQMQAIAPITEPTAYARGGMDNLRDQAVFLDALARFRDDVGRLDRSARQR